MSSDSITAAVFRDGNDHPMFEDIMSPTLRPDEVLVKLKATGICHTDLTCRNGFAALPRPVILGHEGAGHVVGTGADVHDLAPGDPVVLSFFSCGSCANCRDNVPAYCEAFMPGNFSGRRLDGTTAMHGDQGDVSSHFFGQSSFATHSVANRRNLIKVRDDVPLELLGPLGCGIQAGAGSVMNLLKPRPGESIVVMGAGGVGLAGIMAAAVEGCNPIIAVEPNAARRAIALEVGATHALDPFGDQPLAEAIAGIAPGGVRNALDTTGIPSVLSAALEVLGLRGKLVILTTSGPTAEMAIPLISFMSRGITIHGTNAGDSVPAEFIPRMVDLVASGQFPLEKIVKFYPFNRLQEALDDQESGLVVKPIVTF